MLSIFFYTYLEFKVTATGQTGQSSQLVSKTAAEKLNIAIDKLLYFSETQRMLLESDSDLDQSDVTSINLVQLGVRKLNVFINVIAPFK